MKGGRKVEERKAARELAADLARRIQESQNPIQLESEARELAKRYGDWVTDAIIDELTGGNGTYPQSLQDRVNRLRDPSEITSAGSIHVSQVDSLDAIAVELSVIDLFNELVPADYHNIRRAAKLRGVESSVWYRWLAGYGFEEIARDISSPNCFFDAKAVSQLFEKACMRVSNCAYITWRTCYAQDLSRGRDQVPPSYISWREIILEARRHQ